jgi:hypothetical protein
MEQIADPVCSTLRPMREGDIIVTRVARHYALGRVLPGGRMQTPLENHNDRDTALSRACTLAGLDHHVFLLDDASSRTAYVPINCSAIAFRS